MTRAPLAGDIWFGDLDPIRGHEQGGYRPVLVVSCDDLNQGTSGLIMTVPLTTRIRQIRCQVLLSPPEGGLDRPSAIKCEQVRALSRDRLTRFAGRVSGETLAEVRDMLRVLLDL